MADNPVKRFAAYSDADLTQLVIELEKGDDRLLGVLSEIRTELARRHARGAGHFWRRAR